MISTWKICSSYTSIKQTIPINDKIGIDIKMDANKEKKTHGLNKLLTINFIFDIKSLQKL